MSLPTLDDNDGRKKNSGGLPSMPPLDESPERNKMPPLNKMPSLDDISSEYEEEFEDLEVDEALYYDEDDEELNEDVYEEAERRKHKRKSMPTPDYGEEEIETEDDYYPEYEEDLENYEEESEKFIDKKKKRLIPFGGKKSKKMLVKSSDFDDRKNLLAKTKITQFSIIAVIFLMFLIGLKNTFMPSHVYTDTQIKQFAAEGAGQTGFPQERGRFFVENFMDAYLTLDKSDPTVLQSLSYYYGKENFSNSAYAGLNMSWSADAKQNVIVPPKVYEINLLTEYSAQYKVSAYVSNVEGEAVEENKNSGRWLSFSVNLYYDTEKDSLAITEDSPTLVPHTNIMEQTEVPNAKLSGNGTVNKEIYKAMAPTIDGFIEEFAKASLESHNSVLQYIHDKNDIKLYDGFGGALELNGKPEDAIKKVIYDVGDGNSGIYEVEVTVKWTDALGNREGKKIDYTSKYQMGVRQDAEGKFAVTYFKPFEYLKPN